MIRLKFSFRKNIEGKNGFEYFYICLYYYSFLFLFYIIRFLPSNITLRMNRGSASKKQKPDRRVVYTVDHAPLGLQHSEKRSTLGPHMATKQ